ncbi:DUF4920 domain-containing protein [Maribacter algicola]|uniref:DUF4920 domain-containing protein n=1 Tax=Meishania litoralis TaxID=3434685 RepID=A0ACC7LGE3_9FLAO
MKNINILVGFLLFFIVCNAQEKPEIGENTADLPSHYRSFGQKIAASESLSDQEMALKFDMLGANDTLNTKFTATVTDVCQSKGCWMKLALNDKEVMVRFKDYGFFVPMDISGKEVVVNGKAFVEAMGIEDQKHYAKDGGQSAAQIAKITEPKKTYSFEADGVLLKE